MKTNANKSVSTVADFTELTTPESRQITGGTNPPANGVVAGPNGEGCTGPFWPFPKPYPPFQGPY